MAFCVLREGTRELVWERCFGSTVLPSAWVTLLVGLRVRRPSVRVLNRGTSWSAVIGQCWSISLRKRREGSSSCGYSLAVFGAAQMCVEGGRSCYWAVLSLRGEREGSSVCAASPGRGPPVPSSLWPCISLGWSGEPTLLSAR